MKENNNTNQIDKIIEGLDLAFDRMLEFKKYKKTPVIIEKDGKIVEINPEVLIEERNKEKECS